MVSSTSTHSQRDTDEVLGTHKVLSTSNAAPSEPVLLPQAALTRGARLLEATATLVRSGVTVVSGIPDDAMTAVADAFICDAATLRILLADHGAKGGATPTS